MRLKYYLRGLGIGIVVTAVIMGVSMGQQKATMTDEQIIARAKELGMEERKGVLAEIAEESLEQENQTADTGETIEKKEAATDSAKTAAAADTGSKTDSGKTATAADAGSKTDSGKTAAATDTDNKTDSQGSTVAGKTETSQQNAENAPEKEPSQPETVQQTASVVVAVYPGEGSYTVSRKLAALGLVESADIYDKFLCQNGYDKKLCTGNYTITQGATADEIAKILTKHR